MQSQSSNKFDEFVRSKSEEADLDASFEEQWGKMSRGLDKKDFLRFALFRFNIYYLSLILIGLIGWAFYFLSSERNDNSKKSIQENVIIDEKGESSTNGDTLSGDFPKKNSYFTIPKQVNQKDDSLNKEELNAVILKQEVIKDSIPEVAQVKFINKQDSLVRPLSKKIKYITKRDTIVTVDTTKVRRKR